MNSSKNYVEDNLPIVGGYNLAISLMIAAFLIYYLIDQFGVLPNLWEYVIIIGIIVIVFEGWAIYIVYKAFAEIIIQLRAINSKQGRSLSFQQAIFAEKKIPKA